MFIIISLLTIQITQFHQGKNKKLNNFRWNLKNWFSREVAGSMVGIPLHRIGNVFGTVS